MSAAFNTQLTFDWTNDSSAETPVIVPTTQPATKKSSGGQNTLVRKEKSSGVSVNLGVPATAKPMDDIMLERQREHSRRNRTDHISDLLLVVLDRYGISPDEFMATLKD